MALTATPFCVAVATMSLTSAPPSAPLPLASGRIPVTATAAGPAPPIAARTVSRPQHPPRPLPVEAAPQGPAAVRAVSHPHHPAPATCRSAGPEGGTRPANEAARETRTPVARAPVARAPERPRTHPAGHGTDTREVPPAPGRASPRPAAAAPPGAARDTQVSLVLLALALVARAVIMRRRRPGPPGGPALPGGGVT